MLVTLLLYAIKASAQQSRETKFTGNAGLLTKIKFDSLLRVSDTLGMSAEYPGYVLIGESQAVCKLKLFIYGKPAKINGNMQVKNISQLPVKDKPWLAVHGSVMYDVFYQSNIDTPFFARNTYQHNVAVALDITAKDKLPVRLYVTSHLSNSPFLRNYTDLGLQFNNREFTNKLLQNISGWAKQHLPLNDSLKNLQASLNKIKTEYAVLNNQLSNHSMLQQLVEERERQIYAKKHLEDSITNLLNDSLSEKKLDKYKTFISNKKQGNVKDSLLAAMHTDESAVLRDYNKNKDKLDSLKKKADSLQLVYLVYQKKLNAQVDSINTIYTYGNHMDKVLPSIKSAQLPDTLLPKGYKALLAIRSLGIGRCSVDFSELSVKNISINGIKAEYNPGIYLAVAAGTINYRFRDFIVNESAQSRQYLTAIRFGKGYKDGDHVYFTYFTGRKQLYNYSTDSLTTSGEQAKRYNLLGWSIEGRYQINKSTYIVGEVAKSSMPYYNRLQGKQGLFNSSFNFNDRSNEAYAVSFASVFPATATKINGYYKKLGANFQSFSMFTTSSAQSAWSLQVSQPFFKKALQVNAGIKKNDFSNPYITQAFYTNIIFKTIQATLRLKHLPVISVGYYPSSQLTKLGEEHYTENLFYTLVATGSHFYKANTVLMSTIVTYTQFYNKTADSNFVYFNTTNVMLAQQAIFPRITLQTSFSGANNNSYSLYTAGAGFQYKMFNWFSFGGDVKYNRQTVFNNKQIGYGGNAIIKLGGLGEVQFMVQKTYLPGPDKQLVKNDIGRLVYYKTF